MQHKEHQEHLSKARGCGYRVLSRVSDSASAHAQSFEVGGGVAVANSSEFDATDIGVAGRLAWNPIALIGVEAEMTWYPQEFPDSVSFSSQRVEGLFGVTAGPRFSRFRPFARVRAGFLSFAEASRPIVCLAIYPPPLSCVLATGKTMPAFDFGAELSGDDAAHFARVDTETGC